MVIVEPISAREWKFEMGKLRTVSFDLPDDYECVFSDCSTQNTDRYVFSSSNGVNLSIDAIIIDDFNKKSAKGMPDSILIPHFTIIGSEEPTEGVVSRIIMSRLDDGSLLRHYVFFTSSGIVILNANSPDSSWNDTDHIANTFESHFKWGTLLIFILAVVIGMIPSVIVAVALGFRKKNLQKFWILISIALLAIIILSIVFSLWNGSNFWLVLIIYSLFSAALGYFFEYGGIIVM